MDIDLDLHFLKSLTKPHPAHTAATAEYECIAKANT
jgi:hypothetical protein